MPKSFERSGADAASNESIPQANLVDDVYQYVGEHKKAVLGTTAVAAAAVTIIATKGESIVPLLKGAGSKAVAETEELAANPSNLIRVGETVAGESKNILGKTVMNETGDQAGATSFSGNRHLFNLNSETAIGERGNVVGGSEKPLFPNVASATGTMGRDGLEGANVNSTNAFSVFDHNGYQFVPARSIVHSNHPMMNIVDGPSKIVFGENNAISHIRVSSNATEAEKADLLLQAGYSNLIHSDPLAAQAAAKFEGQSAGFVSQKIERWATPEQMQENALVGARAYLDGDAASANKFTEYLTERFGPMTQESKGWGRHIVTDSSSPGSPLNRSFAPVTETLLNNGIEINVLNRSVAANSSVLRIDSGDSASAIRGGAAYLESKAASELPHNVPELVRNAWYERQAAALSPDIVNTVSALTNAIGESAGANVAVVDKVAQMVGPVGQPEEYVNAYHALNGGAEVIANLAKRGLH